MRNRYSLHRSNLSSAAGSCYEGQSDINLSSDTYSDLNTEADTDIDIELSTGKDDCFTMQQELNEDLDSEAEEILKDIDKLRADGPAKHPRSWMTSNRKNYGTILHLRSFVKSERCTKDNSMTKAFIRSREVKGRSFMRITRTQSERLVVHIKDCTEND